MENTKNTGLIYHTVCVKCIIELLTAYAGVKRDLKLILIESLLQPFLVSLFFPFFQDNLWKTALSDNSQKALKAFDMVFVLAEKSYEGYDYYDFFERVHERLKEAPFYSNLSSDREVRHPA